MKMKLRYVGALMMMMMLAVGTASAEKTAFAGMDTQIVGIKKYGNLVLDISGMAALETGLEYGDIITAYIGPQRVDMPVCSNYSDVEQGEMVCRITVGPESADDEMALAINGGDLATTLGIAQKRKTDADPGYEWVYASGYEAPVAVHIELKEKGGDLQRFSMQNLVRSNVREDYAHLTDEEYANFRMVTTTGMGHSALFRSGSPIRPELNRCAETDAALDAHGVRTIVNLADTDMEMHAHEGFAGSHYAKRRVIALGLNLDLTSDTIRSGMAEAVRFMLKNDGPYLIHCNEGKDRTGFFAMIFECLTGATLDEVRDDYMMTYANFYGITQEEERYDLVWKGNLLTTMRMVFAADDLQSANLAQCARTYLRGCGLTDAEIDSLRERLMRDWTE